MEPKKITRDELVELQHSGKAIKLVDVLDSESYVEGHLPKAISIPLEELRKNAAKFLAKTDLIVVYCGSFSCPASTKAAKILISLGYENVLDYKGGLADYQAGNLPLEKSITLQAKPITLIGKKIVSGETGLNFSVVDTNLNKVTLDNYKGKIKVITSFVSLDTPVCNLQVKQFNKEASKLSKDVVILAISKDLPFAQKRFCTDNNITNLVLLSDYQSSSFGINYGLLIKENNLLARATIILDTNNIIRFIQIVDEITHEPDYQKVLDELAQVVSSPMLVRKTATPTHCVPCEIGTPPLAPEKINTLLPTINEWELIENKKLTKEFKFEDFITAKYFLDLLANIAEEQGHHPTFSLLYNKLKVTLTTQASGGLTMNDFIMAKIIDAIRVC